jgi:hypothetical protein
MAKYRVDQVENLGGDFLNQFSTNDEVGGNECNFRIIVSSILVFCSRATCPRICIRLTIFTLKSFQFALVPLNCRLPSNI